MDSLEVLQLVQPNGLIDLKIILYKNVLNVYYKKLNINDLKFW